MQTAGTPDESSEAVAGAADDTSAARDSGLIVIDAQGRAAPVDLNTIAHKDRTIRLNQRFARMWEIPDGTLERIKAEHELRRGIERHEFEVFLQPQAVVGTNEIVGAEALVRWRHPDRGLLLPGEFIPIAEDSGLIVELGEHVLRATCERAAHHARSGMPPVRVAVNLSAVQFREPNLPALVSNILDEHRVPPKMLELEITETTAMQHAAVAASIMKDLASLGVGISLDDFGTGYSSLQYLQEFPIDALKIDQSFMRGVTIHPNDDAIVGAVIAIGDTLGMNVIAEGIETQKQLTFLRDRGCTWYQGFLLGRPMPMDDFDSMMQQQAA